MICALCIAASAALQTVFAPLGTNCAVYLSVLICAMCCPLEYGVCCAVILPVITLIESQIPTAALLPAEIGKCLVFAVSSKLLLEKIKKGAMYDRLYLCTDHTGFYERYGWKFIGTGYHPWGESSRIYISPKRDEKK